MIKFRHQRSLDITVESCSFEVPSDRTISFCAAGQDAVPGSSAERLGGSEAIHLELAILFPVHVHEVSSYADK